MLAESKNAALYPDWLDHIKGAHARGAFVSLVGYAACLRDWHCHPQQKGTVRDVRFLAPDGQQHFAFIVNVESLLFYLRSPAIRELKYDLSALRRLFDSTNENKRGEWTVRLSTVDDVHRLTEFLALR